MTITYKGLKNSSCSVTKEGRTHTNTYQVQATRTDTDTAVILAFATSTGFGIGDVHSEDAYSFITEISANRLFPDGVEWEVTVVWGPWDTTNNPINPLSMPPQFEWNIEKTSRIADVDNAGNPIQNSAKMPFADPVEVDDSRTTLRVSTNEATFNEDMPATYVDTVNNATWRSKAARTVKCESINARLNYDSTQGNYYSVVYEFAIKPDTWDVKVADVGYEYTDGTNHYKFMDEDGRPATSPKKLDGTNGTAIADSADMEFLTFQVYEEKDFSVFNFT